MLKLRQLFMTINLVMGKTLPAWEPADCITVHKSQGSEFDDVLLVLPDDGNNRLLTREIIYTGITRARRRAVLLADRDRLRPALAHWPHRRSGLFAAMAGA